MFEHHTKYRIPVFTGQAAWMIKCWKSRFSQADCTLRWQIYLLTLIYNRIMTEKNVRIAEKKTIFYYDI
jgi:hypothetical protein